MKKSYLLFLFCIVFSYANAQFLDNSIKKTTLSTIQNALDKQIGDGYTQSDLNSWIVQSDASSRVPGMWHYYIVQTHNNIEIRNAIANVSIKDGVATINNSAFIKDFQSKLKGNSPSISADQAVKKALDYHKLKSNTSFKQLAFEKDKNEYTFNKTEDLQSDIKVKLIYDVVSDKEIKLTWNVNLDLASGNHWWNTRIDAQTGAFVSKNDWVLTCSWGTNVDHSEHQHSKTVKIPNADINFSKVLFKSAEADAMMTNAYRALPYYIESPNHGDFELIVSPQDATASPNGWHDDVTSTYNTTRGNNVVSRDDQDGNNGTFGPLTPESSPGLVFDYPYGGPYVSASTYIDAAQTNVFYVSNAVHDIYYKYGFDEASGNFQENNLGRGGTGSDPVDADVQDGSGINNANFSTPTDGGNGRMQMFLWDRGAYAGPLLEINNTAIAGEYAALNNSFSPGNVPVPSAITADLVLVVDDNTSTDPSTDANDGCGAITNAAAINGKIAVVRRGACAFTLKTIEAQNAGAIAILVVNNVAGDINMGGGDAAVSIPAYSINQADGDAIIATMASSTVNATFNAAPTGFVNIDGDFDNGVIAHEYGHGINIRLVAGRFNSGSDVANSTYTVPHGVGSVWAGILWDMTWDLIAVHGFTDDIYDANGGKGNTIALNLVVEGMKLTACNPGFEDGRDAILQADMNLYGGANQCVIWSAFARRGVGFSADQGNTNSTSDGAHAYDLPPALGCTPDYIITNGDSGEKSVCTGTTSATYEFVFNEQNGYDVNTPFVATGLPAGATATFLPVTMKDTGLFTMTVNNIPATVSNYTITVTPGGNAAKAVTSELTVNATNPDLTDGDTEFAIDGGAFTSFSDSDVITVTEGEDLGLRLPSAAYDGTATWTGPNGAAYNSDTVNFVNVTDADPVIEGSWTLTVSFTNDCPAFAPQVLNFSITINPALSVNDFAFDGFKMYPNPTNGLLTIESTLSLLNSKVAIYDVTGRTLMNKVNVKHVDDTSLSIDMSQLSTGAYFVSIETDSNKIVKRIIKN